jgi:hypothetical protein
MVRRGSTVRVRQRALERPAIGLFCCLHALRPTPDRPSTCPQDPSPTVEREHLLGLNRAIGDHRAPPCSRGGRPHHPVRAERRAVTPEVAGSSPVALVKIPANRRSVLSGRTPKSAWPHKRSSDALWKRQKGHESPCNSREPKPFLGRCKPGREGAACHTKWPEVKASPAVVLKAAYPASRLQSG